MQFLWLSLRKMFVPGTFILKAGVCDVSYSSFVRLMMDNTPYWVGNIQLLGCAKTWWTSRCAVVVLTTRLCAGWLLDNVSIVSFSS